MTHSDWDSQRERLSAYLDDELSATERADIDAHLPGCDTCQRELAALHQMRGLLRALPAPALPRMFTLPEESPTTARRSGGAPRWARPTQALGGLAAAVGLGLLVASALPHPSEGYNAAATYNPDTASGVAASTAAIAPSPTGGAPSTAAAAPSQTGVATSGTATAPNPTSGATTAPAHSSAFGLQNRQNVQPFPTLPVTGGTLLVGGAAALTLGSLARRRGHSAGLPEAEPED